MWQFIWKTAKEKEWRWIARKVGRELAYTALWMVGSLLSLLWPFRKKTLTAYCEVSFCPISFDALYFLMAAELARKERKCKSIKVVFYPSRLLHNYGIMIDEEGKKWRFFNLALPFLSLFPHITSYAVYHSRWRSIFAVLCARNLFPYHPASFFRFKVTLESCIAHTFRALAKEEKPWGFEVSPAGKRFVRQWTGQHLNGRKLVVITLRHSPIDPLRNSKVGEWALFAKACDPAQFWLVFVMDTDTVLQGYPPELKDFTFFDAASWNLGMRAALYEEAYLCLGTFIGPCSLYLFNPRGRFISFKVSVAGTTTASDELMASCGFIKGENIPWATPFQKIVWEDDDYPVIQREFTEMYQKIDQQQQVGIA